MNKKVVQAQPRIVLDMSIREVYEKFITSRGAMRVTKSTMTYYKYFLPRYLDWLEQNGILSLEEAADPHTVDSFLQYMAGVRITKKGQKTVIAEEGKGKPYADSTIHIYARTIRTMLIYAYESGYIRYLPRIRMPILRKKKLLVLTEESLAEVLKACETTRDLAIVLLYAATGMRRGEMTALNWGNVDFARSTIDVLEGKGEKYRLVKFDRDTGKVLMRYKLELGSQNTRDDDPVFQNRFGERLASMGHRSLLMRLSAKTGIPVTAHSLRRTFAKLCIKRKMDLIFIQNLMGHASADTTERYIQQLDDEDISAAYEDHTPLGELARKALRQKQHSK